MECDSDKFHIVIKGKGIGKAKITHAICCKCGTIYENKKSEKDEGKK